MNLYSYVSMSNIKPNREKLYNIFKALADKNRFQIMFKLLEGQKCVCELTLILKLEQTLVSHHISVLKKAGLIKTRRFGKWTYCYINTKMLADVHELFEATFQTPSKEKDLVRKKYAPKCV